jgi:hypothetical protein
MSWDVNSACGWFYRSRRHSPVATRPSCLNTTRSISGCPTRIRPSSRALRPPTHLNVESSAREFLTLEHDFGMLRPGQRATHAFLIHNPSDSAWTLARITNTCVCTATDASATVIAPGTVESVEVAYAARGISRDERRDVTVEFREAAAPRVSLAVFARIRDRCAMFPPELLVDMTLGDVEEETIEVHNYGDDDWPALVVAAPEPWISTESISLPIAAVRKPWDARQAWRVVVRIDSSALTPGSHAVDLTVHGGAANDVNATLPTQVRVRSPVEAYPAQYFFGVVPARAAATREVIVRFHDGVSPPDIAGVRTAHDLSDRLSLEWKATDGQNWRLAATLTPGGEVRDVEGAVRITFPGGELPELAIPVQAIVQTEATP